MAVKGNINPTLFLPNHVGALAAACRATLQSAPARGFILSTGCLVPRDSTGEAFTVMAAAMDTKGPTCSPKQQR